MNLTIEQLRVFAAVAAASSFSDAAQALRLTQPAVSRTIQSVEGVVGTSLFSRTTRKVELTADGTEFLSVAAAIIEEFESSLGRFDAFMQSSRGTLTVAALPVLASGLLASIVSDFLAPRPQVQLHITTGSAQQVLERLRRGEADVAITEITPDSTGLQITPLGSDPMCVVVPRDHPLAESESARWKDLLRYDFITLAAGTSVRRLTDEGFSTTHAAPKSVVVVDATMTAVAMMSRGLGITAFPLSTRSFAAAESFTFIPLRDPTVSRELAVLWAASPAPSALARTFTESVLAASRESERRAGIVTG
ncbi:LysR substrate-binding domain-containing protein [Leifsonia sp. NPDC056665]|uniref:LysR substrate-binding domain-containing protein n=1 Tax=Leifsonia sp. NPDC056665 TaxID=3345901 RepID=UPI0036C6C884